MFWLPTEVRLLRALDEKDHVDHFGLGVAPFSRFSVKTYGVITVLFNDLLMGAVVVVNFKQGASTKTRHMKSFAEVSVKGRNASEYTEHYL